MCEIYLDDPSDFGHEKWVTARKQHDCDGCRGLIPPGMRYTKHFSIQDGDVCSEKLCRPCRMDRDRFCAAHDVGWFTPSSWLDFMENCIDEDGAAADPRWRMMKIRADQRRKEAYLERHRHDHNVQGAH